MAGMNLVVDRKGSALSLSGQNLLILNEPGRPPVRIGVHALDSVVMHGDVRLSASVLRALHQAGVSIVAFPGRGCPAGSVFSSFPTRATRLRHIQHVAYADRPQRLDFARQMVLNKLHAQQETLSMWHSHVDLGVFEPQVRIAADIGSLLGIEGAAAKAYFAAFSEEFPPQWHFPGRDRRPPGDPLNAMLSLAYVLALGEVQRHVVRYGLDPGVGFLHGLGGSRPALALDLLEGARPVCDLWLSRFCCRGEISVDNFTFSAAEGCRLDVEGRKVYYRCWFADAVPELAGPIRRGVSRLLTGLRKVLADNMEKTRESA